MSAAARPVALVTGAARGIGAAPRSHARVTAIHVVLNFSRSREAAEGVAEEAAALGAETLLCQADVADEPAVVAMLDEVRSRFGRLDGLVNNAGTTVPTPPSDLDGLSMDDWDRVFAVNVRGTFQVTRAAVPLLRDAPARGGRQPGQHRRPAAGAAALSLRRQQGGGGQPHQDDGGALGPAIRVNAVAPGWMVGDWMEHALGENYERLMERRARMTPLKRCVTPDEVAVTIVNLHHQQPLRHRRGRRHRRRLQRHHIGCAHMEPLDGVVPYPPEFAARYRARGYWKDRTLDQVFGELFERHADRVALEHGRETITYAQLADRRAQLAAMLHNLGLRRRDRVIMHLPNAPEFLYLYFALQMIGVIPVLALVPHRRLELDHFARLTDAVAYFGTDDGLGRAVQQANPSVRHIVLMDELLPGPNVGSAPPVDIDPMDPCCLLLSGGTTGVPKLIPRTHNDYVYNSHAAAAVHYIDRDSCQLAVAPLAHNMPLACPGVQGFLMHGARVVLSEGTRAAEILPLLSRHRVTHIAAVPALYIRWLADPDVANHDLSSVELLQSGGQRLQPELRRRMAEVFPNAFVQENFG